MTDLAATTTDNNNGLLKAFETGLDLAGLSLMHAQNENLFPIADQCFIAFQYAKEDLSLREKLPIIPGTDPNSSDADDSSSLKSAFASVYGYERSSPQYATLNPHSMAALKALQGIANELHLRGLAIFT